VHWINFSIPRSGLIFYGKEGVVPIFMFRTPELFSEVPSASCPIFMLRALILIFDVTEGIGSSYQLTWSRTSFRQY
jgi:hypothetical protein